MMIFICQAPSHNSEFASEGPLKIVWGRRLLTCDFIGDSRTKEATTSLLGFEPRQQYLQRNTRHLPPVKPVPVFALHRLWRGQAADSDEERFKEFVHHPAIRIDGSEPAAQGRPAVAIGRHDMLAFDKRTLVEQWSATARMRPFVERLQELVPVGRSFSPGE